MLMRLLCCWLFSNLFTSGMAATTAIARLVAVVFCARTHAADKRKKAIESREVIHRGRRKGQQSGLLAAIRCNGTSFPI
jgi:hypothetical protein